MTEADKTFISPEVFFDLWQILDEPQKFPFMQLKQLDKSTLLIQNTLFKGVGNYICISAHELDCDLLKNELKGERICLSYYSRNKTCRIPDECAVSLINSSVIYQRLCSRQNEYTAEFVAQKATVNDLISLSHINENLGHDYIQQIRDAVNDENYEVFVLKCDRQAVCFLIITDQISNKFNLTYKCISTVYTLPEYRKHGYAKYLLDAIIDKYRDCSFLYIADSTENTASNSLAKACGFDIIGYNHQIEIKK